jgi:hypothetical protein
VISSFDRRFAQKLLASGAAQIVTNLDASSSVRFKHSFRRFKQTNREFFFWFQSSEG